MTKLSALKTLEGGSGYGEDQKMLNAIAPMLARCLATGREYDAVLLHDHYRGGPTHKGSEDETWLVLVEFPKIDMLVSVNPMTGTGQNIQHKSEFAVYNKDLGND